MGIDQREAPFDTALLDRCMEEAGIDILLATSKHNVQYLLGGHRAMFFGYMDAIGLSRYLPVFIYPRGRPEQAAYIGHRLETPQREVRPFWTAEAQTNSSGSVDAIEKAADYIRKHDLATGAVGVEAPFLPLDSAQTIDRLLPGSRLVNAVGVLERLRHRKSPAELALLREASDRVVGAMAEAFEACRPGMTKAELVETLKIAEAARGLSFEYCLITAGTGMNRAASDQPIAAGDIISLDSGGNYRGYVGDVCRMGVVGEPDAELQDLLRFIDSVQQAAFQAIRPGALGRELFTAPEAVIAASSWAEQVHYVAHGMGLVTHEAPHLTTQGAVPYPDDDAARPLEPGAVISIETTLKHPRRGFIKLEDTAAVTETGFEVFGNALRGWNRTGTRSPTSLAAE